MYMHTVYNLPFILPKLNIRNKKYRDEAELYQIDIL